jgi:small subunit ribosomal protein S19
MARSSWKGPFCEDHLIKKAHKIKESGKLEPVKTWARSSTILPMFVGITFNVHNGKKFLPVSVTEDMVGRKLGEFSPTRTFKGHGAGKK